MKKLIVLLFSKAAAKAMNRPNWPLQFAARGYVPAYKHGSQYRDVFYETVKRIEGNVSDASVKAFTLGLVTQANVKGLDHTDIETHKRMLAWSIKNNRPNLTVSVAEEEAAKKKGRQPSEAIPISESKMPTPTHEAPPRLH